MICLHHLSGTLKIKIISSSWLLAWDSFYLLLWDSSQLLVMGSVAAAKAVRYADLSRRKRLVLRKRQATLPSSRPVAQVLHDATG